MEAFLLCNRLFIGLSFPLHSLSSLANPSYGNLVLSNHLNLNMQATGIHGFVDALE